MAVSITDIGENTKLAREMSLLGNYETSTVYYQGVVQMIHRLLGTIDDPVRKMKWQQIQGEIAQEYDVVKNIMTTLNAFKGGSHDLQSVGPGSRSWEEPTRDPDVWPPPPAKDPAVWDPPTPVSNTQRQSVSVLASPLLLPGGRQQEHREASAGDGQEVRASQLSDWSEHQVQWAGHG